MTPIVFEGSQAHQWDGRSWRKVRPEVAEQRIDAGEAYCFASRERAEALGFIPLSLTSTGAQRRECNHDWMSIGWIGYPAQVAAGWRYRCRKCGEYRR